MFYFNSDSKKIEKPQFQINLEKGTAKMRRMNGEKYQLKTVSYLSAYRSKLVLKNNMWIK